MNKWIVALVIAGIIAYVLIQKIAREKKDAYTGVIGSIGDAIKNARSKA